MEKTKFSSKDLLNKKFKGVRPGYDPLEVDIFLDKILSDYYLLETLELLSKEEYDALINKIKELETENKKLSIENASMKGKLLNIKDGDHVTTDNVNLIKRINLLEKFLYEIGYDPSKIK